MWWLFLPLIVLLALFWPTSRRRFSTHTWAACKDLKARNWDVFDRNMRLARLGAQSIRNERVRQHSTAECHLLTAQGAYHRGNFDEATRELSAAIRQIEKAQAPDCQQRLAFAHQLWGEVHFDRDELDQAAERLQSAIRIVEVKNELGAIFGLQRLSDVLLEKGDYEAAMPVAERCVIAERKILAQSAGSSISMTEPDLALARRDFERAETLFREKADYWGNKVPLPDNIDVTRYFFHLARAQEEQNRLTEARATLEKACSVARLDYGAEHPRVAKAQRKLDRVTALI